MMVSKEVVTSISDADQGPAADQGPDHQDQGGPAHPAGLDQLGHLDGGRLGRRGPDLLQEATWRRAGSRASTGSRPARRRCREGRPSRSGARHRAAARPPARPRPPGPWPPGPRPGRGRAGRRPALEVALRKSTRRRGAVAGSTTTVSALTAPWAMRAGRSVSQLAAEVVERGVGHLPGPASAESRARREPAHQHGVVARPARAGLDAPRRRGRRPGRPAGSGRPRARPAGGG